jgi:hypothetical protein
MTFIILFTISLIVLVAMILRKSWQLEHGRLGHLTPTQRSLIGDVSLAKLRTNSVEYGKRGGHYVIMSVIKGWVIITHISGKALREKFPKYFTKENMQQTGTSVLTKAKEVVKHYSVRAKKLREKIKMQDSE